MKKNKYARCYGCYAYESLESPGLSCIAGEKQNIIQNNTSMTAFATRHFCRVKNIKDLVKRQEEFLGRGLRTRK